MHYLPIYHINKPVTSFSQIRQVHCHRLQVKENGKQQTPCQRCGQPTSVYKLWDIEGDICCPSCSALESVWYTYH